jgi:protein SCO1
MNRNSVLRSIVIISALIAFGSGIGLYTARQQHAQIPSQIQGLMWPDAKILQAFTTIDQNGDQFSLQNLQGKWSFLFFGYTHCPDICPVTLSIFDQVYKKIEVKQVSDTQMIFVSVDPVRDSSDQLRDYVNYFNEEFIGLGGSVEQIESLTKQLGIPFFYQEATAEGDYLVDHSSAIFLISPENKLVAIFSAPHQVDDIFARFLQIKSFIDKNRQS